VSDLKNAQYVFDDRNLPTIYEGFLWRGELHTVDGFSLGLVR
jgi:hypothetical protein